MPTPQEGGLWDTLIYIPLNADPEDFLSTSAPEDGWKELWQIFLALRAHDQRIEENLAELLHLYIPKVDSLVRSHGRGYWK